MPYGIGLIFDPLTEARIREVWGRLARQGFATPLTRPGCLPHVSLVLSEALCVEGLAGDLAAWGQDGTPLEVQIATVGVFTTPELVLFYPYNATFLALCFSALTMGKIRLVIAPLDPGHKGEALLNRIRMEGQHNFE